MLISRGVTIIIFRLLRSNLGVDVQVVESAFNTLSELCVDIASRKRLLLEGILGIYMEFQKEYFKSSTGRVYGIKTVQLRVVRSRVEKRTGPHFKGSLSLGSVDKASFLTATGTWSHVKKTRTVRRNVPDTL